MKGSHVYQELLVCCGCFGEIVDLTFHQTIEHANKIMKLFEETQNRLEKVEADLKLERQGYDNLVQEFKIWAGGKAKLERLRRKTTLQKN